MDNSTLVVLRAMPCKLPFTLWQWMIGKFIYLLGIRNNDIKWRALFNKNSRGYTHNLRRFIFIKRKRKNKSSFVFPLWTREEEEKKKLKKGEPREVL